MPQEPDRWSERRAEPRRPTAFAFWFRPARRAPWCGAWMLDTCSGGAAFLVASEDAPPVGSRVDLRPMFSQDRLVREESPALPPAARVIRHDEDDGVTRRIAVRFDLDVPARLKTLEAAYSTVACRSRRPAATPPPGAAGPAGGLTLAVVPC